MRTYFRLSNPAINNDCENELEILQDELDYFFMDPISKWRHKNTKPWKLVIQILKIFVFTSQLVLFGSDMAKFITYKDEMQTTFKQLFLENWDPSSDALAYPGPYIPNAVYTKHDYIHAVNYAIMVYSNISELSLGPFGYPSNRSEYVPPITFCTTQYAQSDFDPSQFKYNYSLLTNTDCKVIEDFADAGSEKWLSFDIRSVLEKPIDFSRLISTRVEMPLRTLLIEDATSGANGIVCLNVDIEIIFDNRHRDGQIVIELSSIPRRARCEGSLIDLSQHSAARRTLNIVILSFCLLSFILCARSIWKAYVLARRSEMIVNKYGRTLNFRDRLEFLDSWLVLIMINDFMIALATIIISFYDERLLETDNYTICSLLIGLGNFFSWSGLLRYLSFFKNYNLLIVTLRKSFIHVMRFMLCTLIIYCGFCFCGWIVFGPYHFKFRQLSTTTECLFALINGDDMFETFALLRSDIGLIWWFSRIYLYLFVTLFIYVVLSLFIALIMDAYEIIKQYTSNGFPKTRLQSFYIDRDMSKLVMIATQS